MIFVGVSLLFSHFLQTWWLQYLSVKIIYLQIYVLSQSNKRILISLQVFPIFNYWQYCTNFFGEWRSTWKSAFLYCLYEKSFKFFNCSRHICKRVYPNVSEADYRSVKTYFMYHKYILIHTTYTFFMWDIFIDKWKNYFHWVYNLFLMIFFGLVTFIITLYRLSCKKAYTDCLMSVDGLITEKLYRIIVLILTQNDLRIYNLVLDHRFSWTVAKNLRRM